MGQARAVPLRLGQLAVPAAGAVLGVVAGVQPLAAIALALAVGYALVVLADLAVGVALFVVVSFLEAISVFGGLSLAKAAGALLLLSWVAFVATRADARQLLRDRPGLVALLVTLGAWTVMTALWADEPGLALTGAQSWILNLALFPVVYSAIRTPGHLRMVLGLFVVGALISAAIGVASGTAVESADSSGRLGGSGVNANELGELLIVAVVLAGALSAVRSWPAVVRAGWLGLAAISALALVATYSRGALVGFAVALLVAPVLIGPGRRLVAGAAIVAALLLGGGYLAFYAPAEDVAHITQGDTTGSGRTDIWKVGWRMVKAHPVVGVGVGNYSTASVDYLLEPGTITRSDFIVDDPKPAHNVYLQVLAETGVVGFLLFAGILVTSVLGALGAARRFRAARDHDAELLARALAIGLCGLLASAFFSTAIYSKQLWLLLALTAAVSALARERARTG